MKLPIQFFIIFLVFNILYSVFNIPIVKATYNPLSVPNNKVGIHIISATPEESSPAALLANTNGDWGYVTVLMESGDLKLDKWQTFFDDLRRRHLIPLVRLATHPDGEFWVRPFENEESTWADFLDKLNWPTKNRYVIVYNEPNQAHEWGNQVDATSYAQTLDKTIAALKAKSADFFVLNAGLDASAPQKLPAYQEEASFISEMNQAVPGIFNKLDGWVSHSYPNPGFVGSANGSGKGTVRTFSWERQLLRDSGLTKNLPIFITETGWKHAEGINYERGLPTADEVAQNYLESFENAWTDPEIVAVTPFLLNYQDSPFDHFSFKKYTGEKQNQKILGVEYPDYYPSFNSLANLIKVSGLPIQENKAQLTKGQIYSSLVSDQAYTLPLTFKNIGQSIWGERDQVKLIATQGADELEINQVDLPAGVKVEPNHDYTFNLMLKAPASGQIKVSLNLYSGNRKFDSQDFEFNTEVKAPVILKVKTSLAWKNKFGGDYFLGVAGAIKETFTKVLVGDAGTSEEIEAKYLLPDYSFDFTLEKPFYQPKTIHQTVHSGINVLDFGTLQPDIASAVLHPRELWKLLPLSN